MTTVALRKHSRQFRDFRYVYPVISRRAGGLSIGINLNPDKRCNFNCSYCQVDRRPQAGRGEATVDLGVLEHELRTIIREILSPSEQRGGEAKPGYGLQAGGDVLKDIALSGDGEPTTFPDFAGCVDRVSLVRNELCSPAVRLVLITNASELRRVEVISAIERIDEVWAKLDAGSEEYYQLVCRGSVPFARIIDNLCVTARLKPLVIQSMFIRWQGQPPPRAEIEAYARRLVEIQGGGGSIDRVQIYTVARPPADGRVTALADRELRALADFVRSFAGVVVETFGGWSREEEEAANNHC